MDFRVTLLFLMTVIFIGFWLLILLKGPRQILNRVFSIFVINMALWSFGLGMFYKSQDPEASLFWANVLYLAGSLIPAAFLHFSFVFPSGRMSISRFKQFLIYVPNTILFYLFFFTPIIVKGVTPPGQPKGFIYGPGHILWDLQFDTIFTWAFVRFCIAYKRCTGIVKMRLRYIILGTLTGVILAGITNVIMPWFNRFELLWLAPPLTLIWLGCIAYAIIRYRLMDIAIAITRLGIFVVVYSIVLGLPFAVGTWFSPWLLLAIGRNWWLMPLGLMAILATAGPFIYIYLERKAEDRLLKEQRRYQDILKQASLGMTQIRNLNKLLKLIVYMITRTVQISYAGIYVLDKENAKFQLRALRDSKDNAFPKTIDKDALLVRHLQESREPLVFEEIKRQLEDNTSYPEGEELKSQLLSFGVSVIIPCLIENHISGFIILGEKRSGKIYSEDDLRVFTVLANQAALAIENARFFEEAKELQEQISQAEKMATIGTMADGLSHQINNRFYALSMIAGDTLDTIKLSDTANYTLEQKELLSQIKYALERILSNVLQGGEVVKGMLKYTRKGEEGFLAVSLDDIINSALEMVQYKIKLSQLDIIRDYPKDTPAINGNLTQLQEVFFNLIDNAYDAMLERRDTLKEPGYRGRIRIYAEKNNGYLKINIEDNAIGAKPEDLKKMFTPFFTTKVSSRKGTGLGLYVIKKIITSNHNGKISVESVYRQGTRFILELPLYVK